MIVVFNGPPGCGKDTAAIFLKDYLERRGETVKLLEFKDKLTEATIRFYGVTREWWENGYTRELKDVPCEELHNKSRRQALIYVSEDVLKPIFGPEVFGLLARGDIEEGWNIFSDGGFDLELKPIVDKFGNRNILIVRIFRSGCTYQSDSRNYYSKDVWGCKSYDVINDDTLMEFKEKIISLM